MTGLCRLFIIELYETKQFVHELFTKERTDCHARPEEVNHTENNANASVRHAGRLITYTSHQIGRALDACIAAQVHPDLTGMRGLVLGHIVRTVQSGKPLYQRDLEECFRIRRSSVTAMLKAMESAGFITRTAVAKDARLKSLAPTVKGLACYENLERCIAAFEDQLRCGVTQADLNALVKTLDLLRQNAQSAVQQHGGSAQPTKP